MPRLVSESHSPNQRLAPASHIAAFTDNLGTSVLGMLFVVLGARVELSAVRAHLMDSVLIAAALVFVARPVSVLASTIRTGVTWRTRGFLMTLAPRGVVAAAVASLFALELEYHDIDPGPLEPVVFTVVVVTVGVAGLTAAFAARRLQVAQSEPTGVALIGGGAFAVAFAEALGRLHVPVIHIGLEDRYQPDAVNKGQLVYRGRIDSDNFHQVVSAVGVGTGVALSGVDHLDRYATERLAATLETSRLFGLADDDGANDGDAPTSHAIDPRPLLPDHITPGRLADLMANGKKVRITPAAHHPRSGWLTICRVDQSGTTTFDTDPTSASEREWLIQLGPGLAPTED